MICDWWVFGAGSCPKNHKSPIANHKFATRMKHILRAIVFMAVSAASAALHAQAPRPEANSPQPTVTFTLDWPSVEPHRYVIAVDSEGNAVYRSWTAESSAEDPYVQKFAVSAAARDRIFTLARQLNYFNGDFEYHKHRVAFTGDKTLAYADSERQYVTRYNWSENGSVMELTTLFQGMSATIESGRHLEHLYRFDRLGLDEELKNLESLAADHQAAELQIIAPVLEQLASDPAVMNMAHQRARHILQMAGISKTGNNQPAHQ